MARHAQLKDLRSDRFLKEIHHLLWMEPSVTGNTMDTGWNCRDHAWVIGLLSLAMRHNAALVSGEAFFAKGPTAESAGASFTMRPHNWVTVQDAGPIDLSVRPVNLIGDQELRVPVRFVFAGRPAPGARSNVYFLEDAGQFARLVEELPLRRNHTSAAYLTGETEYLHAGHLTHAAGWIGSVLTRKLDAMFGNPSELYAALFLHLDGFLDGRTRSLADLPFDAAWNRLAAERTDAIARARDCIEARINHAPAAQVRGAAAPWIMQPQPHGNG